MPIKRQIDKASVNEITDPNIQQNMVVLLG